MEESVNEFIQGKIKNMLQDIKDIHSIFPDKGSKDLKEMFNTITHIWGDLTGLSVKFDGYKREIDERLAEEQDIHNIERR